MQACVVLPRLPKKFVAKLGIVPNQQDQNRLVAKPLAHIFSPGDGLLTRKHIRRKITERHPELSSACHKYITTECCSVLRLYPC